MFVKFKCKISHSLSPLERRFRDIQIVIITNSVVVLSVGIRRVDCTTTTTTNNNNNNNNNIFIARQN